MRKENVAKFMLSDSTPKMFTSDGFVSMIKIINALWALMPMPFPQREVE